MWSNAANQVLPASPWLKHEKKTDETDKSTEQRRSRTQQALVSIWNTVGGVLAKQPMPALSMPNNVEETTALDVESPIPEADLREYERILSARSDTASTSARPSSSTTQLPIISPRFSPREDDLIIAVTESPLDPIQRRSRREIYTPPARDTIRDRPRTPSADRPNYAEASCRARNKNYIESVVCEARGLCEALLDTEEADEYVELHASVLNAQETATTIRLARTGLQQNWGAVFYVPSQLKVIGWCSKQYLVIDKLTLCSTDGGPSPAMIAGVKVGDVVVGVNGKKIVSNMQFVEAIKKEISITLDVVRPNEMDEITDEQFEDQQDELMKEVLEQARRNAINVLGRMRRMSSRQKRVFLEDCV